MRNNKVINLISKFLSSKDRFRKTHLYVLNILANMRGINSNEYPTYPLSYTSVSIADVKQFLSINKPDGASLIVVHTEYIEEIQKSTTAQVVDCLILDHMSSFDCYEALYWATDRADTKSRAVRFFIQNKRTFLPMMKTGPGRCWHHDPIKEKVMRTEFNLQRKEGIEKFGYGTGADFGNLLQTIDQAQSIKGCYVEIGCYFGSSSCTMVRYMAEKGYKKSFYFFDVFDGFNYEEAISSSDSTWAGTHKTDGREAVEKRIKSRSDNDASIHVIKRNVCEENPLRELTDEIAFANIDVDIYEAVYASLHRVNEKLAKGGIVVVEDAGHTPWLIGATAALNEFLDDVGRERFFTVQMESGQYVLVLR